MNFRARHTRHSPFAPLAGGSTFAELSWSDDSGATEDLGTLLGAGGSSRRVSMDVPGERRGRVAGVESSDGEGDEFLSFSDAEDGDGEEGGIGEALGQFDDAESDEGGVGAREVAGLERRTSLSLERELKREEVHPNGEEDIEAEMEENGEFDDFTPSTFLFDRAGGTGRRVEEGDRDRELRRERLNTTIQNVERSVDRLRAQLPREDVRAYSERRRTARLNARIQRLERGIEVLRARLPGGDSDDGVGVAGPLVRAEGGAAARRLEEREVEEAVPVVGRRCGVLRNFMSVLALPLAAFSVCAMTVAVPMAHGDGNYSGLKMCGASFMAFQVLARMSGDALSNFLLRWGSGAIVMAFTIGLTAEMAFSYGEHQG